MPGVRGVVLAMPGTLRIEPGAEQTLTMFGDRAVLPAIETRVRGGILYIRLAPGAIPHPGAPTQFVLTAPGLESAELADCCKIECASFEGPRLGLRLADTGALDFGRVIASELEVSTAHVEGSVRVAGEVQRQTIELQGGADYEARSLESAEAQVTLAGRGSATLRVRDRLRVTITGSGSVYYYGEPEIESSISGSGQLVPMGG